MENRKSKFTKEDLKIFLPGGGVAVMPDAFSKVDCTLRGIRRGQALEAVKILEFKSNEDFEVLCIVYQSNDISGPQKMEPFHISELSIQQPQHLNRLKSLYFLK